MGILHLQNKRVRKERYAILVLLERRDRRAVPLLVSVWQAAVRGSDRAWKAKTTEALVQALDDEEWQHFDDNTQSRLRQLGESLLPSRRGNTRDLGESETGVLVSALRFLYGAQSVDGLAFLRQVAALPITPGQPNRMLVREVAESLLRSGNLKKATSDLVVSPGNYGAPAAVSAQVQVGQIL